MPWEISFTKSVTVSDPNIYINQCCWGGDVVRDHLLSLISARYQHILTHQEDWGWFIWFRKGPARLSVDIFCDDLSRGDFRLRLASCRRKLFFFYSAVDMPELAELRDLVQSDLNSWAGALKMERVP